MLRSGAVASSLHVWPVVDAWAERGADVLPFRLDFLHVTGLGALPANDPRSRDAAMVSLGELDHRANAACLLGVAAGPIAADPLERALAVTPTRWASTRSAIGWALWRVHGDREALAVLDGKPRKQKELRRMIEARLGPGGLAEAWPFE